MLFAPETASDFSLSEILKLQVCKLVMQITMVDLQQKFIFEIFLESKIWSYRKQFQIQMQF